MANRPKPWKTEYARSEKSKCKVCKKIIKKNDLRIARMVQARKFDGYMPLWNHGGCIMKKRGQIRILDDVEGVDLLRWEDQQKLKKYVENLSEGLAASTPEGLAASTSASVAEDDSNKYVIENAKGSRAACKICNEKITRGKVCIGIMSQPDNSRKRGKVPGWHHAKCFLEMCMWTGPMDKLPGWDSLTAEDKEAIQCIAKPYIQGANQDSKKNAEDSLEKVSESSKNSQDGMNVRSIVGKLKKRKPDEIETMPRKKQRNGSLNNKSKEVDGKLEESSSPGSRELERTLEEQSKALWKIKDDLEKYVKSAELKDMLRANGQSPRGSEYDLRECCADGMLFGALKKCPNCGDGLKYSEGQYVCIGKRNWGKCTFSITNPDRQKGKWKIPKGTDNEYLLQWFKSQSGKKLVRILPQQSQNSNNSFLDGLAVAIVRNPNESHVEWKHRIEAAGGKLLRKLTHDADCLVMNEREIDKHKTQVERARKMKVPVLRESYLVDSLEKRTRLRMDEYKVEGVENFFGVKVKSRSSVLVESRLQGTGHILEEGKSIYFTILNKADVVIGENSYYILQVIENDKEGSYHVFRKWGRVGNDEIGCHLNETMTKSKAIDKFKQLFYNNTGNTWAAWLNKDNFEKQPGKFFPREIDYGVDESRQMEIAITMGEKSKLDPRVIDLLKLLFDPEIYRDAMLEFDIDMSDMPCGKVSRSDIQKGFEVLTELENLISHSDIDVSKESLIDASNRFFTFIPSARTYLIENKDQLKSQIQMLEALRDIEIAYGLIRSENKDEDPLDANYKRLRCNISPLPRDSSDYQLVKKYLDKAHASDEEWELLKERLGETHAGDEEWELELEDVFIVDREREDDAYVQYKNLQNRMLLWHGSRVTNFVGILSQGLRIAPPEAPVTGYDFGKGIYFADLARKSAQFCPKQEKNPVGLMLLSEVALGEVFELQNKKPIKKLPKRKQSTKGVGKIMPLENEFEYWRDEVVVPCGRPVPSGVKNSKLDYNEYIVYDTAQVRLQFLLKVRFHRK